MNTIVTKTGLKRKEQQAKHQELISELEGQGIVVEIVDKSNKDTIRISKPTTPKFVSLRNS